MPQKTHTKILATIGPSSASKEQIEKLIDAGCDAFRFNFSHGTHAEHKERFEIVRKLSKEKNRHITLVADMQGPKLRVGEFRDGSVMLKEGQKFVLDMEHEPGDESRVELPHKEIFEALKAGEKLLLNDGNIALLVKECGKNRAVTEVLVGGPLSGHKGVNLPNIKLPISAITEKDRNDLEFALKLGFDWISLSFVQSANDVREARDLSVTGLGLFPSLRSRARLTIWKRLSSFPTVLWLPAAIWALNVRCRRCRFCKSESSRLVANMRVRSLLRPRCWNR